MLIQQAYRYELKPNNKQKTLFAKYAGTARFAYNWGLARRIEEYKTEGKSSNAIKQHRQLNALKKTDFPWMYEASKCAPQESLRDLDRAFNNFFRGLKTGQKVGFPKFKKKGIHDSFRLTGSLRSLKRSVVLPRLGEIRTKERTNVKGRILSVTVSREADRWFAAFSVKRKRDEQRIVGGKVIGLDVGINSFAVTSEGERLKSPKPLNKALSLLKRRSKQHSRKKPGSSNRKKSALKLARLHRKIKNRRRDFLHKASTRLAKTKPGLVVENLNVGDMIRNRCLSRHIADSGWTEFFRMLEYKTAWYGSTLVKAPRFYGSSKICSRCGAVVSDLTLSQRQFSCPHCGLELDRDENAARNLESIATASSAGRYACEDPSGGGTQNNLWPTSHGSLKQEADTRFSSGILG